MERGIRQGCPMSGSWYAIGLDLFARWYLWEVRVVSARMFACADDSAMVLLAVWAQLVVLSHGLRRCAVASAQELNPSEGAVIPFSDVGFDFVAQAFEDVGIVAVVIARSRAIWAWRSGRKQRGRSERASVVRSDRGPAMSSRRPPTLAHRLVQHSRHQPRPTPRSLRPTMGWYRVGLAVGGAVRFEATLNGFPHELMSAFTRRPS